VVVEASSVGEVAAGGVAAAAATAEFGAALVTAGAAALAKACAPAGSFVATESVDDDSASSLPRVRLTVLSNAGVAVCAASVPVSGLEDPPQPASKRLMSKAEG
jgi:hypothetical protein